MSRILIVDDSIIMRRNLRVILTQAGHEIVAEASNGREAFAEYEKNLPDLVTMDITMPVMNGIDAVKKIISVYPEAKIIMISALDQRNMVFEALENGAKHYVIKPITPDKVLTVLNAVLDDSELNVLDTSQTEGETDEAMGLDAPSKDDEEQGQESELPPFAIENKEGTFIISIHKQLDEQSFAPLSMAVQGFMFVKPLKLVFDFGNIIDMDKQILAKLAELAGKIKTVGGSVEITANGDIIKEFYFRSI